MDQYGSSLGLHCNIELDKGRSKRYSLHHNKDPHTSNPFMDRVKTLGLYQNKHIPERYLVSPRKQRLRLLAGLINSDGWCSKRNGINRESLGFSGNNKTLVEGVERLCNSLGYSVALGSSPSQGYGGASSSGSTNYRLSISGDFSDLEPLLIEKKKPCARSGRRNSSLSRLTVRPLGEGSYFGFEIDGDERFLLEDGTVTHNCGTGFYLTYVKGIDSQPISIIEAIRDASERTLTPAPNEKNCGNFKGHNEKAAKEVLKNLLRILEQEPGREYQV